MYPLVNDWTSGQPGGKGGSTSNFTAPPGASPSFALRGQLGSSLKDSHPKDGSTTKQLEIPSGYVKIAIEHGYL